MLNETKTLAAIEALRAAATAIEWLEAASDSAHTADLLDLAAVIRAEAAGLRELAAAAGFHPEHDVDDYDPTDDANSVAEAGDADWSYDDGQPDEAQEWYDFDPDC